ncbi:hypothetical protein TNCV_4083951 [Trichonephila clavipes]|nr:hypothetical protein TNCV_4083951 [Trichonephila clavipes]
MFQLHVNTLIRTDLRTTRCSHPGIALSQQLSFIRIWLTHIPANIAGWLSFDLNVESSDLSVLLSLVSYCTLLKPFANPFFVLTSIQLTGNRFTRKICNVFYLMPHPDVLFQYAKTPAYKSLNVKN